MARKHKRIPGSRSYTDYLPETVEKALDQIANGSLSIRAASNEYKIPFGTLYNKFKGKHGRKPGRPPVFNQDEEQAILQAAAKCGEWGFPLTLFDIRMMGKYYLDRKGVVITRFQNNIPGADWAYNLLERHKNAYGQRVATNIKRARAAVSKKTLEQFFNNIENVIKDIPSSNIFNYDESNLADDPGKKRCIYRRGVKYPEKVMNHSKSCTTIMVCGSADGTLLPPYVIYKSLHLYDTWKENGPVRDPCCTKACCSQGTRYNRTSSGWIDGETFRDWFKTVFLPHAKRLEGRKALIGDNLSSHMDPEVLQLCNQNDVDFVCLVPNSTHLCQPLDVAFFRPMKTAWRAVLSEWKLQNLRLNTVPKDMFPTLLKQCLVRLNCVKSRNNHDEGGAIERDLKSGFRACGLFPLDRNQVLQKLPDEETGNSGELVESALISLLKEQRFGAPTRPERKKKRLTVLPGCSVATYGGNEIDLADSSDKENSNEQPLVESLEIDRNDNEIDKNTRNSQVDQFLLVKFQSKRGKKTYKYVCQIVDIEDEITVVGFKSVGKSKSKFKRVPNDISEIKKEEILEILPEPCQELDEDENIIYTFNRCIDVLELGVSLSEN